MHGFELGNYWAWLRYLPALHTTTALRLRAEWTDLDSHQKTVLSDEVGMGITCTVVCDALNIAAMVPTNYLISRLAVSHPGQVTLGPSGKIGPAKSPDFIGIDAASAKIHVIECKGTQTYGYLQQERGPLRSGLPQKRNVRFRPKRLLGEALVVGVYIPQYEGQGSAHCIVIDPPADEEATIVNASVEAMLHVAVLGEVASALHMMGMPREANALANGEATQDTRAAIKSAASEWQHRAFENDSFAVRQVEQVYPQPYEESKGRRVGRMRFTVGLSDQLLEALLTQSLEQITQVAYDRAIERPRRQQQEEDRYAESMPSGLFLAVDLTRA